MNLSRKLFLFKFKISTLIRKLNLLVVSVLIIIMILIIGLLMYVNENQNTTMLIVEDGKKILVFGGKDYLKMRKQKTNDGSSNMEEARNGVRSFLKQWRHFSKYQTRPERIFHLIETIPSTTVACESTVQIDKPPHLSEDTTNWQTVGTDGATFVYSAYLDRGLPPYETEVKVLIIGITRDYHFKASKRKLGLCVLWFRGSSVPIHVESEVNILPESHEMRYSASYHTCDFDRETLGLPYAVSLVPNKCEQPTNILNIKYSSEQPSSEDSGDQVNFTVCVTPVNREFNDYHQVVEMIEVNRLFGAQRVTFYDYSTGSDVSAVLSQYVKDGLVEVLPWNLPLKVDRASNNELPIHYYGQLAALNDCLHLNKHRSRFIVFSDIDELLVPRMRETWAELIDDVSSRRQIDHVTSGIVYAPVYSVQNVFFRNDWRNYTSIRNIELIGKLNLRTLLTTKRESKIYPHEIRSKYIVNPRLVRTVGVHFVYELSREGDTNFEIEVSQVDALLHHYRRVMWASDPASVVTPVEDKYMHRYAEKLVRRVAARMKQLGYLSV